MHKRNINFTCNSERNVFINVLDMEMHRIKGFTAFSFDNLQKTMKKLVWKHMKFYTMTYYITSSTAQKIFTINCKSTSLKRKNEFKEIHTSFIRKDPNNSPTYRQQFIQRMHIADGKSIQPFCHLNTSNTCQKSRNYLPMI